MFAHDYEAALTGPETKAIHVGSWIGDKPKIQRLADSDGRTSEEVVQDPITGMVGEWGGYRWVTSLGYKCECPDCKVLERNEEIWNNDLIALEDVRIRTPDGTIRTVSRFISCKAQSMTSTFGIKDEEPSWTWQDETAVRSPDPMLSNPHGNKLVIASWVDNRFEGNRVVHALMSRACERGFRWRPRMVCFWWPDVFPYLAEPRKESLKGMKKVLYYKDIKHLTAEILHR